MAEAYDRAAADYDRQVLGDDWMRNVLWERYARLFRPGQVVLDVGCGTGIDALFLAQRGNGLHRHAFVTEVADDSTVRLIECDVS